MQRIFFTPGPSALHPRFSEFMGDAMSAQVGSISHRSSEFKSIFKRAVQAIRAAMKIPSDYHVFFMGSATEAMERIIESCVRQSSFHFVNGAFSERFFTIATELKKLPVKIEVSLGHGFEITQADIPKDTELVCLTQNETSTGVMLTPDILLRVRERVADALVSVDVVSSAPFVELPFPLVDCAFFSVQKLFGLPAGLGVLIVSPRALALSERLEQHGTHTGSFHSFRSLRESALREQTPETPNVLLIYLLARVCEDFLAQGVDTIRQQLIQRAAQLYSLLGSHQSLSAFVTTPQHQSPYVITVNSGSCTNILIKFLGEKGIEVGEGYGPLKGRQIRIANFPAITDSQWGQLLENLASLPEPRKGAQL